MAYSTATSVATEGMLDHPFVMQVSDPSDAPIVYGAKDFRLLVDAIWEKEGVIRVGDFKVTVGDGWSVNVSPGSAVIQGTSAADQGKYLVRSDVSVNLAIPPNTTAGNHAIFARVRDKAYDGGSDYDWVFEVVQNGASDPEPVSALRVANVEVLAGQPMSSAKIVDYTQRSGEEGVVRSIGRVTWTGDGIFSRPTNNEAIMSTPSGNKLVMSGLTFQAGKRYRAEVLVQFHAPAAMGAVTAKYCVRAGSVLSITSAAIKGAGQFTNQGNNIAGTGAFSAIWDAGSTVTNQYVFVTVDRVHGTATWNTQGYTYMPCTLEVFEMDAVSSKLAAAYTTVE